jgi:hypothetical protein
MKKKLMIAGCSFSATCVTPDGTSWSEQLANMLDWDLVNLARQGCSNGGIRIQIEEIRRQRPDFAIITPTFWDRMEIPARATPYDWSRVPGGWDPALQQHLQDRNLENGYNRSAGIDNVNYKDNNYRMICETIFSMAENYDHPYRSGKIDKTTQQALKYYIDVLYDSNWKKQQDEWIITEGVLQLYLDGINFLICPDLLWPFDPEDGEQWSRIFPAILPARFVMQNCAESVLSISGSYPFEDVDPGYHMSSQGQTAVAKNYLNRIMQDHNIQVDKI